MPKALKTRRSAAELDGPALADALAAKLGVQVSLIVSADDDGAAVVQVSAAEQGVELPEFDDEEFLDLADAAPVPGPDEPEPPALAVLDALAESLTDAKTIADVRGALLAYVRAERARRTPAPVSLPDRILNGVVK